MWQISHASFDGSKVALLWFWPEEAGGRSEQRLDNRQKEKDDEYGAGDEKHEVEKRTNLPEATTRLKDKSLDDGHSNGENGGGEEEADGQQNEGIEGGGQLTERADAAKANEEQAVPDGKDDYEG